MSIRGKKIVALIPARGGSKGVPRKNMRKVNGIPLVGYTINAAVNSNYIDTVYLSSDDRDTLEYAKSLGIETLERPKHYSGDKATANQVIQHFISLKGVANDNDFFIVYLQPTSPLRTNMHIDKSIMILDKKRVNKIISVAPLSKSPFKSFILDNDKKLRSLFDEDKTNSCRQDLPVTYIPNGAIYVFTASEFSVNNTIPSNGSCAYIMNEHDSLDIDSEHDFIQLKGLL
jgi:CMP-N,N'-diacetyllegionaminic acid synthase